MKIWHISDTHTFHGFLKVPDVDMVIHSGDVANPRELWVNEQEVLNFLEWYASLPIKYKIFVAGNHDLSIERNRVTPADFAAKGIIFLENASTTIEGVKIWGSPITPSFGVGWAYNKRRDKIDEVWNQIPEDTDIVVTHGPAKGVLDSTYNTENIFERCGCNSLRRHIFRVEPKLFCFGHIHNCQDICNAGYTKLAGGETVYSNGSCVTDGKFAYGATSNGNVFEI